MSVGFKVTRRTTVLGRVYGVGIYPRGVPEDHAAELKRLNAGSYMAEQPHPMDVGAQQAGDAPPSALAQAEVLLEDKKVNPKQLSKKSLAQKLRREQQKAREEAARLKNEQALAAQLNDQASEEIQVDAPVPPTPQEIEAIKALAGPLTEDLPGKKLYEAGGVADYQALINLPTEELLKIPGVTSEVIEEGRLFILNLVKAQMAAAAAGAQADEVKPDAPPAAE